MTGRPSGRCAARDALKEIDREASNRAPLIVRTDGTSTGRSEHKAWTLGTIGIRRVRIRRIARAALASPCCVSATDQEQVKEALGTPPTCGHACYPMLGGSFACGRPEGHDGLHFSLYGRGAAWNETTVWPLALLGSNEEEER